MAESTDKHRSTVPTARKPARGGSADAMPTPSSGRLARGRTSPVARSRAGASAEPQPDLQAIGERVSTLLSQLDIRSRRALAERPELLEDVLGTASERRVTVTPIGVETLGALPDETLSDDEAHAWVKARTVTRPLSKSSNLAGVVEVAGILGVRTRQAVHGRRERRTLIGFINGRRDVLFPRDQFDDRGRVLPGIAELLGVFEGDGWRAWRWLTQGCAALDGRCPLDGLRSDGDIDDVVAAARGYLQGDFG